MPRTVYVLSKPSMDALAAMTPDWDQLASMVKNGTLMAPKAMAMSVQPGNAGVTFSPVVAADARVKESIYEIVDDPEDRIPVASPWNCSTRMESISPRRRAASSA